MSKQKRTLSPEHMCTKLFTNLTTTLFTKPACVYLSRQSPGVKQLLAPAAILPNYIQNHYGIKNSRHFSTSEKLGEKNLWLLWNFGTSSHFTKTISKPLWNVIIENSKIEEETLITFVKLGKITLKTANKLCKVAG